MITFAIGAPTEGGVRGGGSENRKNAQKNVQIPQYRIEIDQNTETAVLNVQAKFPLSSLYVGHSIRNKYVDVNRTYDH